MSDRAEATPANHAKRARFPHLLGHPYVIIMAILLVIYPLSTKPAVYLVDADLLSPKALTAYEPLLWLCDNSNAARRFFMWYTNDSWHWWIPGE